MREWFASGRIADVALLVLLGEVVVRAVIDRRQGTRTLRAHAPNLIAGAALLLALRAALTGAPWPWIAAALAAALIAHMYGAFARRRDLP